MQGYRKLVWTIGTIMNTFIDHHFLKRERFANMQLMQQFEHYL